MRKIFTVIAILTLGSCLQESGKSAGVGNSFIRYYNGGNNDTAQALEITADGGFIILATTKIQKKETDLVSSKIKIIKTDSYGNVIWESLFPSFTKSDGTANTDTLNYTASGLQVLSSGGYVITGEYIQTKKKITTTDALVLRVDENGGLVSGTSLGVTASGKAVTTNTAGNYLVLSSVGTDTMRLEEVDKGTNKSLWSKKYVAGQTTLASKLFVDETGKVLWSGFAVKSGLTGIRMVKTAPNANNTDFDLLISQSPFSEVAVDFCRYGYNYAIVGSTNQKAGSATPGADTDILFKLLASDGTVLQTNSFPLGDADSQNDVGNSISSTKDGGLILLASVNSAAINGFGDSDYYLIKIDAFGVKQFSSFFGSKYKDEGVAVRQTSDGSFVVLGTTTQGALKIITLIKTNANGKLE